MTLRSEWSEFSLRSRPRKVTPFQAGRDQSSNCNKGHNSRSIKTGFDPESISHSLQNYEEEDSIENDFSMYENWKVMYLLIILSHLFKTSTKNI